MLPSTESTFPKTHPTGQSKEGVEDVPFNGSGDACDAMEDDEDFDDMPPLEDSEVELER